MQVNNPKRMNLITVGDFVKRLSDFNPDTYVFAIPFEGDSTQFGCVDISKDHKAKYLHEDQDIYLDPHGNFIFSNASLYHRSSNEEKGNKLFRANVNILTLQSQNLKS